MDAYVVGEKEVRAAVTAMEDSTVGNNAITFAKHFLLHIILQPLVSLSRQVAQNVATDIETHTHTHTQTIIIPASHVHRRLTTNHIGKDSVT